MWKQTWMSQLSGPAVKHLACNLLSSHLSQVLPAWQLTSLLNVCFLHCSYSHPGGLIWGSIWKVGNALGAGSYASCSKCYIWCSGPFHEEWRMGPSSCPRQAMVSGECNVPGQCPAFCNDFSIRKLQNTCFPKSHLVSAWFFSGIVRPWIDSD